VVDDIVEIVGAAPPIMATMPAVRDGRIRVSDLDLAGDDDGQRTRPQDREARGAMYDGACVWMP